MQPSPNVPLDELLPGERDLFFPEIEDAGVVQALLWCLLDDLANVRHRVAGRVDEQDVAVKSGVHADAFALLMDLETIDAMDALMRAFHSGNRELFAFLSTLHDRPWPCGKPRSMFAERYADWVRYVAVRKRLRLVGEAEARALTGQEARMPDGTVIRAGTAMAEVVALCAQVRRDLQKASANDLWTTLDVATNQAVARMERKQKGELVALETPIRGLTRRLAGGFAAPRLYTIAGRPGTGKTALLLNLVLHWSAVLKRPGAIVSLEMLGHELGQRSLMNFSGVSGTAIETGDLSPEDAQDLAWAQEQIQHFGRLVHICDVDTLSAPEIEAAVRPLHTRGQLEWLAIDYLQLMRSAKEGQDRTESVGDNSTYLKQMAKRLQIPILMLAQMNRDVEKRSSGEPKMSDLRDSGQIEQDSDVIIFTGDGMLHLPKNRQGEEGKVAVNFIKSTMRFEDSDPDHILL
ncbi:MAG: DnaB-like helicase C-terminal domain-containing protein [Myxococcota bacterium]